MSASIRAWLLIATLSLIASAARSDGIGGSGVLGQPIFGGIGGLFSKGSGGGGGCAGVIDASKGCPLPMLGS